MVVEGFGLTQLTHYVARLSLYTFGYMYSSHLLPLFHRVFKSGPTTCTVSGV